MKRIIMALAVCGSLLTANAVNGLTAARPMVPGMGASKANKANKAASRVDNDEYICFGYCQDFYTGVGTGGAVTMQGAILIPASTSAAWGAGSKLVKVNIALGETTQHDITFFITEQISLTGYPGTPVYTQEATLENVEGWNELTLDTPYEITGKDFFIGYQCTPIESGEYPIGVDAAPTSNRNGDFVAIGNSWQHAGESFGSVCIQAIVEGDNLPKYDIAVSSIGVTPIVETGEEFSVTAYIVNNGSKTIDSLMADCTLGDKHFDNLIAEIEGGSIAPGQNAEVTLHGLSYDEEELNIPLVVTVTKLNGQEDETPDNNSASTVIGCVSQVFQRNILVEEWTGTWCGWCPRGYVGMEKMAEEYGEEAFIGVAAHNGDPMAIPAYQTVINYYGTGFPGCAINRLYFCDPSYQNLTMYYNYLAAIPATVNVQLTADYIERVVESTPQADGDTAEAAKEKIISAMATVNFSVDQNLAPYRLAFIVTEDSVGPYYQQNYFSGNFESNYLEGWSEERSRVMVKFNEVARSITDPFGITGSLPTTVRKNNDYTYSIELPTDNILDINRVKIVAMVINTETGAVENSAKYDLGEMLGIADINAEPGTVNIEGASDGIVLSGEYTACTVYTIDGKVASRSRSEDFISLPAGVYIVKVEAKNGIVTKKMLIK